MKKKSEGGRRKSDKETPRDGKMRMRRKEAWCVLGRTEGDIISLSSSFLLLLVLFLPSLHLSANVDLR